MREFKAVKKVTITEQIMVQLAEMITSGILDPGEQLPNERELAEQFQVTRSRVREALRALSLVGLITIRPGEGSFVTQREEPIPSEMISWIFHNEINNLAEVYAARKLIESEIYLSAARIATPGQVLTLKQYLDQIRMQHRAEPEKFLEHLDQFDLYIGEISGNRIYSKLMQTMVHLRRETSIRLLHVPGAIKSSIKIRNTLLAALELGEIAKARIAIEGFFKESKSFYENIIENE